MRLFGNKKKSLNGVSGGWWPTIKEWNTGFWQRNIEYKREDCLRNPTVFACISLISSDISKLMVRLVKETDGIWKAVKFGQFEVLRRPNPYQNRIQFYQFWVNSLLCRGNAYVLKSRNGDGKVIRMDILHPDMVTPLVADDGSVYYQLSQDDLVPGTLQGVTVPAREIIHDRINALYHPLCGLPPLFAACLQAGMTLAALKNAANLEENGSRPGGILTAPGAITDETAARLKEAWDANYSGKNYGKTAVLGDDLKYMPISTTSVENQMIEKMRWNAESIAGIFHVPFYKVGGTMPANNNIEALNQQYYDQCLQIYIESIELSLDEGLEIPEGTGAEFDLDGLLRMDSKSQIETFGIGVTKGIFSPNEARRRLNMGPVSGGNTPYLQQQNFSLEALAKRDAQDDPFGNKATGTPAPSEEEIQMDKFIKALEAA